MIDDDPGCCTGVLVIIVGFFSDEKSFMVIQNG